MSEYDSEEYENGKGRKRNGSPAFYQLLEEMAVTHDIKSYDYASNQNPSGNYHFAGQMATMFKHCSEDAGFVGRLAEKLYRLANLESSGKTPQNEPVVDTERDIAVIVCLWMADRRDRRMKSAQTTGGAALREGTYPAGTLHGPSGGMIFKDTQEMPKSSNPLENELLDLIKLMPNSQQNKIVDFIKDLQRIRYNRDVTNSL